MNPHDRARAQFSKTAQAYVHSPSHASGADLQAMLEQAAPIPGKHVLDVATGGGHTALAFARAGATVTASDLTPNMLAAARAHHEAQGQDGIRYLETPAETLPLADALFDIVTCRIAAHHFAEPQRFVQEAARVLKPGGQLMLVDNISPADPDLAHAMNTIERLRDSSHVNAYSVKRWLDWLADAGLEPQHLSRWRTFKPYRQWLERAQTPQEEGEKLEAYVLGLPLAYKEYFRVQEEGGRVVGLEHEAVLIVAEKPRTV